MSTEPSSPWEHAQQVQARYEAALMSLPHVVGVAVGYAVVNGEMTHEPALIVMVERKRPANELTAAELLPSHLDGVRVDVQEMGTFSAF
jgi:hypothetical protein